MINAGNISVYSDDEEQEDLLVSLVQQIRKKKPSKSRRRRRSVSEDEESEGSQEGSHRHLLHVFFCNAHLGINLPSFRL